MTLLEKVRDFYCTALQPEDGPRPNFGKPEYWLYGDGHAIVHLIASDNHYRPEKPHYLNHVAFEAQVLPAYTERLNQLGVEFTFKHFPDFSFSQVFCHDPCGNGVEANFVKSV